DIRRLRQLEEDNAALTAKVERQQLLLREGFTTRDATIRRLNDMLARTMVPPAGQSAPTPEIPGAAIDDVVAEMSKRLTGETARRERLERRLAASAEALKAAEQARQSVEGERDALRQELAAVEDRMEALLLPRDEAGSDAPDLTGLAVLYVGGRANQTPRLR